MPSLHLIGGPVHALAEGRTVVGRDGVCDLVVSRQSVSRRHAQFVLRGDEVFVTDLESNNGTFVNGTRIRSETKLVDNDLVKLYDVPIRYYASNAVTVTNESDADSSHLLRSMRSGADAERRLKFVLEIGRRLGSTLQVAELLPRMLDVLFKVFPQSENGEILLADERGRLLPQAMKHGRTDDSSIVTLTPEISPIAQGVFESGDPERLVELGDAESVLDGDEAGCTICAPLSGPSEGPLGVVLLEASGEFDPFDDEDLDVLTVICLQAGQAIENAKAHERIVAHEQRRVAMRTAHDVQGSILPRERPEVAGYDFHDHYTAADLVGGDYFDYVRLTATHLVLTIGDVCGKSLPAALHMAQLARDVRYALHASASLKEAVRRLNAATLEREGGLITFATCLLDTEAHTASFLSAAHPIPLRRRNGVVEQVFDLDRGGLPLGIEPDVDWHVVTVDVEPGDEYLFVTDGVTDQFNDAEDSTWFGQQRLVDAVTSAPPGVGNLVGHVVSEIEAFRGDGPRSDDRCLVAFSRRNG